MSVSSARVGTPWACTEIDHGAGQLARLGLRSFRNAPEPTLTSSTSASAPSASFLLMIELAISGSDSDGRGDVAQRVDLAVGRRQVARGEDGRADVDTVVGGLALRCRSRR